MVLTGVCACLIGISQVLLDVVLLNAVFSSKAGRGLLSLLVKLALYALGLYLLIKLFRAFLWAGVIGFAVGFFPALIAAAARRMTGRKEEAP